MRKGLICIIGIDGAGKTTHALKLLSSLRKSTRCKYAWLRSAYFFSFPFMFVCRMLGFVRLHNLSNKNKRVEHQYYRNKPIALLWPWVQLMDILVLITFRVYVLNCLSFVICDRYIHDILVDVMVDIDDEQLYKKLIGRLMLNLMPRSATVVMLDVDETTALKRKDDIPNLEYVSARRKLYHTIATYLKIPVVDGRQKFSSVNENILERVKISLLV